MDLIDRKDAIDAVCNTPDMTYYELEQIPSVLRWIPVSERLPENQEAVLITWVNHKPASYYEHITDKPFTAVGVYYKEKWWWWSSYVEDMLMDKAIEVTAWMPLPEPNY